MPYDIMRNFMAFTTIKYIFILFTCNFFIYNHLLSLYFKYHGLIQWVNIINHYGKINKWLYIVKINCMIRFLFCFPPHFKCHGGYHGLLKPWACKPPIVEKKCWPCWFIDILLNQSFTLKKQWSPLHQVSSLDGETFVKFDS